MVARNSTLARWSGSALVLTSQLSIALIAAIGFEIAVVAGAGLRVPEAGDHYTSTLLTGSQGISTVALIVARNTPLLALSGLVAWRLGVADESDAPGAPVRRGLARASYAVVLIGVTSLLWWILTSQAATLGARLVSPWALLLVLPHGPLEFAALFLPVIAVIDSLRRGSPGPDRSALHSTAPAFMLLVVAAFIEVFVSSVLFTTPNLQR